MLFLSVGVAGSGILSASTLSASHSDMLRGVGMFRMERDTTLSLPQFMYQTGRQQQVSRDGDIAVGRHIGTDVDYRSVANEVSQQLKPGTILSSSVTSRTGTVPDVLYEASGSLELVSFPDSSSVLQQNVSSAFQGLTSDVSLRSCLPGSSSVGFGGSSLTGGVQSTFLGLPRSFDMATTVAGLTCLPQMQPSAQQDAYLYEQDKFALGKQQTYSPVVPVADCVLTQQGLPRQPAQLIEMFPHARPRPMTPLPQDDPGSSRLLLDQQPVRLLLPHPVLRPRPPLVFTSGQPSNFPIAVGAPLAVVQEAGPVELVQMPAQFMMEPPAMSVQMHQVPRPGLVTEHSQPSSVVDLIPSFLSDPPLHSKPTPRVILQEVRNRPPTVVRMPSLAPAREMLLSQQHAVSDTASGPVRPPVPFPTGRQLSAPKLVQDLREVQPTCEPQNNANLRLQDTSDQLSAQLHSEYPGSHMLPGQNRERLQQSDRLFSMPSRPLMAPGQMLNALQRLPTPQTSLLPREPSRESLRIGMSPLRVSDDLRSQELGRVANISLPAMEHDDVSSLGRLEQRVSSFSSSTFSSRLPAPAAVMASSQIVGSRLPDERFQSEFRYSDFSDQPATDLLLNRPINAPANRIGPLSRLSQFAFTSEDISSQKLTYDRSRVPSLLDENLTNISQSGSSQMDVRSSQPKRRWKDRDAGEMFTVGDLKASIRQRDDVDRRRTFRHSSTDEDSAPRSSYEPPNKLMKCAEDTASVREPKDVPPASDSKFDCHNEKVTASSGLDAASMAVSEATYSNSSSELS